MEGILLNQDFALQLHHFTDVAIRYICTVLFPFSTIEFPFSFLLGLYSIKWNPLIYCAYMCEYVCGEQRTTFKRNLFFCFLSCGSHKLIKVKPGSKHLHPLRHLTNLFVSIFLIEIYTKKKRNKSFRNILLCFVWEFLRHSLIMWPRLICNWWSSFLSFPNPEIMNIYFWD